MFENRDPHAAHSYRIHEWTSQLKNCHITIFHNHTLRMV